MKISAQEEYGLRCLLRLARQAQPISIPDIATGEGLSQPYVAKLLAVLRRAGLIASERGRAGGYRLARPADEITLSTVQEVLGGPLFDELDFCARHSGTETNGTCVHNDDCTIRGVWSVLAKWTRGVLERISLADMVENEGQVSQLVHRHMTAVLDEPAGQLVTLEVE